MCAEYIPNFLLEYESDLRILKVWKDELKIGNGQDPVIVYGDSKLIDEYLYHKNIHEDIDRPNKNQTDTLGAHHGPLGSFTETLIRYSPDYARDVVTKVNTIDVSEYGEANTELLKELAEFAAQFAGGTIKDPSLVLHEDDKKFTSKFYAETIAKALAIPDRVFESNPKTPLELAESLANFANIPVFKMNVKNPNVTRVAIDFKNFYFAALTKSFRESIVPRAVCSLTKAGFSIETLYPKVKNVNQIIKTHMQTKGNNLKSLKTVLKNHILALLPERDRALIDEDNVDLAAFVSFAIALFAKSAATKTGSLDIDADSTLHPMSVQLATLDQLAGYAFEVNIETLPMFYLNGLSVYSKDCLFIMEDREVVGAVKRKVDFGRDSAFSGRFVVMGYKHVITPRQVYSEFSLQKRPSKSTTKKDIRLSKGEGS